jgi:hypothetical protein
VDASIGRRKFAAAGDRSPFCANRSWGGFFSRRLSPPPCCVLRLDPNARCADDAALHIQALFRGYRARCVQRRSQRPSSKSSAASANAPTTSLRALSTIVNSTNHPATDSVTAGSMIDAKNLAIHELAMPSAPLRSKLVVSSGVTSTAAGTAAAATSSSSVSAKNAAAAASVVSRDQLTLLRNEKSSLKARLREFDSQFLAENGRNVSRRTNSASICEPCSVAVQRI